MAKGLVWFKASGFPLSLFYSFKVSAFACAWILGCEEWDGYSRIICYQ